MQFCNLFVYMSAPFMNFQNILRTVWENYCVPILHVLVSHNREKCIIQDIQYMTKNCIKVWTRSFTNIYFMTRAVVTRISVARGTYLDTMKQDSRRKGTSKNFDQVVSFIHRWIITKSSSWTSCSVHYFGFLGRNEWAESGFNLFLSPHFNKWT